MNTALKPVLTSSSPQNPPVTTQVNKQVHPQNAPNTYGQPQGLVNLAHNNPTTDHSHPNPAHQSNHFSLSNLSQHYPSNAPSAIPPVSSHSIPNVSQGSGPPYMTKNVSYSGEYQPNLGHPPNQNPIPPVSQNIPATTQPAQSNTPTTEAPAEKPQSNGTPEIKSREKTEPQENHVSVSKPSSVQNSSQATEQTKEIVPPPAAPTETTKPTESAVNVTPVIHPEDATPAPPSSRSPPNHSSTSAAEPHSEQSSVTSSAVESEVDKSKTEVKTTKTETAPPVESSAGSKDSPQSAIAQDASTSKDKSTPPSTKTSRATVRKSKTPKSEDDKPSPKMDSKTTTTPQKPHVAAKSKRNRIRTQPYQCPIPEIEIITKISSSTPRTKNADDKLIVFYKNEFLAVRNSEGGFYVCQAVQNIYKHSPKIKIRWLSQDKNDKSGEVYTPDFYDTTDFDCILTNLNLVRIDKGKYRLPPAEKERTDSILNRSLAVEKGEASAASLTEEHPDGLDLSLYKEESQLKKKKATKRKASPSKSKSDNEDKPRAKVRKVTPKSPKKVVPLKPPATTPQKKTPSVVAVKKTIAPSRTERAKKRGDNQNHNKVSPVVDQKKAKMLAKVARKTAVVTSPAVTSKAQSTNKISVNKAKTPAVPKKSPPKVVAKKLKKSSRK